MRTQAEILLIAAALLGVGIVSVAEAALLGVSKVQIRQALERRHPRAALLDRLTDDIQPVLSSLIVVLNFCIIVVSVLVADVTSLTWGEKWLPLTALIALVFLLTFCEIAPKTLGVRHAEPVALRMARTISAVHALARPVSRGVNAVANVLVKYVLVRLFGGRGIAEEPALTEEELKRLVETGEEQGALEEEEREMIHGVIELADKGVHEVMVPRTDMVCLPLDATAADAAKAVRDHGHSRIPIYEESVDHITGIVYARDLMPYLRGGAAGTPLSRVARPVFFVPESKKVDELLREMQRRRVHMGVVVDEHGGTAGLITIENLLEEIVGEILDEYDVEEQEIRMLDSNAAVVDARANIGDVAEAFSVRLPEGDYDSLGGFLMAQLGHVPREGEQASCEGLLFTVAKMDENRIHTVRVVREPPFGE